MRLGPDLGLKIEISLLSGGNTDLIRNMKQEAHLTQLKKFVEIRKYGFSGFLVLNIPFDSRCGLNLDLEIRISFEMFL